MKPRLLYLVSIDGPQWPRTVVVPGLSVSDVEAYMTSTLRRTGETVISVKEWNQGGESACPE